MRWAQGNWCGSCKLQAELCRDLKQNWVKIGQKLCRQLQGGGNGKVGDRNSMYSAPELETFLF